MKSIIPQEENTCYLCDLFREYHSNVLHEHHIFYGSRHKKAEEMGLKLNLCLYHHTGDINGNAEAVHFNKEYDLMLKKIAQAIYESKYGHDQFVKEMGKSWL